MLFGLVAVLDLYWHPAILIADIRFRILNPSLAKALRVSGEHTVAEFLGIGWFDICAWVGQILIATWVADKLAQPPVRPVSGRG